MAEWRYIASRLHGDGTEEILDPDLPLLEPQFTKVLSGPDGMTARVAPAVARLLGDDGNPLLEEWSTAIYAEESGVIRAGTILTNTEKAGAELSLTGVGFTAAIKNQPYSGSIYFVEAEVLDIVRHIWTHWQGLDRGNLGLVVDAATKTGTKIGTTLEQVEFDTQSGPVSFEAGPFKLNEWSTDDLGGEIDKLATEYGFDYRESHSWDTAGVSFTHRLDFGVPRIGTRRHDLRFVVGENVLVQPNETTPADSYASGVLIRGAGEGATMKRAFIPRAGESRLRRVAVFDDKQLKSASAARARGKALLPLLTGRADIAELQVAEHDHAPIGSWVEGDEIEVFTDTDWGDNAMWLRILSTTYTPNSPNAVTVAVTRADKIPS